MDIYIYKQAGKQAGRKIKINIYLFYLKKKNMKESLFEMFIYSLPGNI